MKYGMLCAAIALTLAGCATSPDAMHRVASQELCVDYAQAVLTGQPVATGILGLMSASDMEVELKSRGESCMPHDVYLRMATTRIQLAAQKQQALMQSLGAAAQVQQASRPYTLQPATHSTQSTCGWNGNQWQCSSVGN